MKGKKIIIDGSYGDDTTVVLCKNGVIEELRHQNATQNFIQGNIYLAKIDKIEPALQAAFVNYGNGKSGFLKFSEIHPKYYDPGRFEEQTSADATKVEQAIDEDNQSIRQIHKQLVTPNQRYMPIHNLIKVDQTVLVQIEKDERGTKGASLTTFLSLSGRYCVLLLNSTKANMVSKMVDDENERQRLKQIAAELCMLQTNTSVMLKASAAYKTKIEIARDFGYLMRLWENIQRSIVGADAPLFVHEEGDIIKKSIRDMYDGTIDEIIVSGDEAYHNAREFMKLLLPKYLNRVKHYQKPNPIFIEHGLHEQIQSLYSETVSLASGGYLVITQSEALTSIDVNSGRSKSDHSVEETASRINVEAAHEIVKQIKLRNLSGLIVIDFIDMYSQETRDIVEKIVKDGLASQTTKALVSKISDFGLLEISRQRLGNSLYECVFHRCKECSGRGKVRSYELTAVAILKAVCEEIALAGDDEKNNIMIEIGARREVVMEIINERKKELSEIEKLHNVKIVLKIDDLATLDTFFVERKKNRNNPIASNALSTIDRTYYFSDESKKKKSFMKHSFNEAKQSSDKPLGFFAKLFKRKN